MLFRSLFFFLLSVVCFCITANATQQISPNVTISSIDSVPNHILEQIISYAEYQDISAFKNLSETNKRLNKIFRNRTDKYKYQIDQQHFENQRKLLRLANLFRLGDSTKSLIEMFKDSPNLYTYLKELKDFHSQFYNPNFLIKRFQTTLELLKKGQSFEKISVNDKILLIYREYRAMQNNLRLDLKRGEVKYLNNRKQELEDIRERGKDLKIGPFFFNALDKLEDNYLNNIKFFLENEESLSKKMEKIWSEEHSKYEDKILHPKTLDDFQKNLDGIQHCVKKIKKRFKEENLPDPFYGTFDYMHELKVLEALLLKHKRIQDRLKLQERKCQQNSVK